MNKVLVLGFLLLITLSVSAQYKDLIVTNDGDSIACEIIDLNENEITLMMKYDNRKVETTISRDKIIQYEYDTIQEDLYRYKSGTSYITGKEYKVPPDAYYPISPETYSLGNLQTLSNEELAYYFVKAEKKKKTGLILSIGGPITSGLGLTMFSASWAGNFGGSFTAGTGLIMFVGGIGVTLVGLPILITGSTRVNRINKLISMNNIKLELKPDAQYNLATLNYEPTLTLSITF